jgi:probable rRNA maturation factor
VRRPQVSLGPIREAIEETLRREQRDDAEVSVLIANDVTIRSLNRAYRGIDSPTDVLAFAMNEGSFTNLNPHVLGDVVISVERAQVQAKSIGHSFCEELRLLAVHGTLHLLGYEDQTPAGRVRMHRLCRQYVKGASKPGGNTSH